ncbi:protein lifeguard 3-like [Cimex lectularius]|uniref:Nmda receptor glutamate-binding chain n=1 Tax=Cimex lectularius TaxID=79782 RepID=A0A8I6TG73_CIMLE|nr:protein lifeguard 3-like [Cimex lectularius]
MSSFDEGEGDLHDKDKQRAFLSKVYLVLSIQLLFTGVTVFLLTHNEASREWLFDHPFFVLSASIGSTVLYLIIACCDKVKRSYPLNIILLILFTICTAVMAAGMSARYRLIVVQTSFIATATITIVMSLLAIFAPCDVTGCSMFFVIGFVALTVLSIVNLILSFFMNVGILHLIISGFAVLLLSFYIMFLTQLLVTGQFGDIRDSGQYIEAVICLYSAIIDIFIHLLPVINAVMGEGGEE